MNTSNRYAPIVRLTEFLAELETSAVNVSGAFKDVGVSGSAAKVIKKIRERFLGEIVDFADAERDRLQRRVTEAAMLCRIGSAVDENYAGLVESALVDSIVDSLERQTADARMQEELKLLKRHAMSASAAK